MLNGLGRLNVSGLGVFADGLRKPIAVKRPLVSLPDSPNPADRRSTRAGCCFDA